jgi:CheY-like chemotaxis protein
VARILIADDEPSMRQVVRLLLEAAGHEVTEACDGREVLARLPLDDVDLILADVFMPGMDGLKLLAELEPHLQGRIPYVLLTSHTDAESVRAAIFAGASDYVPKPFDGATLVETVERALRSPGRVG